MTHRLIALALALAIASVGCSEKEKTAPAKTTGKAGPAAQIAAPAGNPSDMIVEVDGKKLLRGELDNEVDSQLMSFMAEIPADRVEEARQMTRQRIVEQYVVKTVILNEADKQNITVTKDEEKKVLDGLAAQLPPNQTIEDYMKNSPRGEAAMRQEIVDMLRSRKLVEQVANAVPESTDQEIEEFSAKFKDNLQVPETAKARHILIAFADGDDDAKKADKKKKAEGIREKLTAGADFAELAKESSDCPSKSNGGTLDPFSRGRMVKPFEDAAFTQEVKAVGPIVETQFGYHIIQVMERSEAGTAPRDMVAKISRGEKQKKAVQAYIEGLRSKATVTFGEAAGLPPTPPSKPVLSAPFPVNQASQ